MKRNWIIFFLICGTAWLWMMKLNIERHAEYEAAMAQYQEDLAAWEAQREAERERRQRLRDPEYLQSLAQTSAQNGVSTPTVTQTTPDPTPTPGETTTSPPPPREVTELTPGEIPPFVDLEGEILATFTVETAPIVTIETDQEKIVFTALGARAISWEIKSSEFVQNVVGDDPFSDERIVQLIPQVGDPLDREWPFGLHGVTAREFNKVLFDVETEEMAGGTLVRFTSPPVRGLIAEKIFFVRDNSYKTDLTVNFHNLEGSPRNRLGREQGWGIGWQGGFQHPARYDRVHGSLDIVFSSGGSIRNRSIRRGDETYTFSGLTEWAGVERKFFSALLFPDPENPPDGIRAEFRSANDAREYREANAPPPPNIEISHAPREIDPGQSVTLRYQIFAGPKSLEALGTPTFAKLESGAMPRDMVFHNLPLGMNWLRPLCMMLLWLLKLLHDLVGAWGIAIICTTIVVKTVLFPLTHWAIKNQAHTMIEQQRIRPHLEKIQKKYKGDPMKRNQAIMELYREHNVNPLGALRGCLPMLAQMPVWLALYVVMDQAVELRGQTFLWIPDLSGPDRLYDFGFSIILIGSSFNLLPFLMAFTNFLQMKVIQIPPTDELQATIQKQMTYVLPIFLLVILYQFPSGLILYWIVSNIWGIAQSYYTRRYMEAHKTRHGMNETAEVKQTAPSAG